jgi:hypothetical protein
VVDACRLLLIVVVPPDGEVMVQLELAGPIPVVVSCMLSKKPAQTLLRLAVKPQNVVTVTFAVSLQPPKVQIKE